MKNGIVVLTLIGALLTGCAQKQAPAVSADAALELANAYYTNGLYEAAVQEYLDYLHTYPLDENRQANTWFTIANIYFERLHDYPKALEYYFKVKYLFPQSKLQSEVSKQAVNCLERMNRSTDAQRIYGKEAALDSKQAPKNRPGEVLAQIGSRKITQGDLDFELSQMPMYMQQEFKSKKKKAEFLQQLVLQELLYDSAKRKGLDKDKDVQEGTFRAQKGLMAQKLIEQELKDEINIKPEDVSLYYEAHKDKYAEKDKTGKVKRQKTFAEVQQQAAQDLAAERQQEAYRKLVQRLMQAEDVKLFKERVQ